MSPSELAAAQAYWSQKQGRGARPSDYRPTPAPGRRKAPIPDVTPNLDKVISQITVAIIQRLLGQMMRHKTNTKEMSLKEKPLRNF